MMTAMSERLPNYKEYTLTVASKKLPGVVTSCGNSTLTDVYAVKNESQSEWQPLGNITKFDYEPGYEYQIRISATSYLDRNMANLPGPNTSCWKYYQRNVRIQKICRSILSRTGMRTIKVNL